MPSVTANPLMGPGAEMIEDKCRKKCGEIGIQNGEKCALITAHNSRPNGFARSQLFANSLKDKHICVNRHADRQHQPGDAGERQGGTNPAKAPSIMNILNTSARIAINPESW